MKRYVFGGLLVCLLLLSSGYFVATQAGAHPGIQQSSPHSAISDAHLKALVRQALGQQAVDHMLHLSTQPSSSWTFPSAPLSSQLPRMTAPHGSANGQFQFVTSPNFAGYSIDAEGASWVRGAKGYFHATVPNNASSDYTYIEVSGHTFNGGDLGLQLGTTTLNGKIEAYYYRLDGRATQWIAAFDVQPNDQISAMISWDSSNSQWVSVIEDMTTGMYKWYTSPDDFTNRYYTRASWGLYVNTPVVSRFPTLIGFDQANWLSNWAGWQPISSSAAHIYYQIDLVSPNRGWGQVESGGLVNGGSSFALVPCPGC